MWSRGKNRLSITGQKIKSAFSPSHSPSYDNEGDASPSDYHAELSSNGTDDEDDGGNADGWEINTREATKHLIN